MLFNKVLGENEKCVFDFYLKNQGEGDFPGGAVVKNLPASAGDTGSIPVLGRSHMPQSNKACAPQLLSLCSRAHEPQQLSSHTATTEAHTSGTNEVYFVQANLSKIS